MSPIQEAEVIRLPEIAQEFPSFAQPLSTEVVGLDSKRVLDILGAFAALILFAPVMMVIFLSLSVLGNPVFTQYRVGRGGKLFACYKFRSMVNGAEQVLADYLRTNPTAREEWQCTFKLTHDPRITPMGHFLRKS